jgi:UDP-glucose 4-epimerase
MRVLLTGGAGFIGSHVADRLLERGHEVAVVDDLSSGKRENVPDRARFYETDIRSGCKEVFEDFEPEALCHQAAQMDVRRSVREPDFDADVNVLGTVRLLQNCVEHGVRKVVFASTGGAVYGEQRRFPATEEHPQYPISPYGVSKLAAERYLHFYDVQYGVSYAALRYANVYGPRQDPSRGGWGGGDLLRQPRREQPSKINGTGEQTRDYVYVGDVARANVLALEGEAPNGAYNVGTGVETERERTLRQNAPALGEGPAPPARAPASRRAETELRGSLSGLQGLELVAGG